MVKTIQEEVKELRELAARSQTLNLPGVAKALEKAAKFLLDKQGRA